MNYHHPSGALIVLNYWCNMLVKIERVVFLFPSPPSLSALPSAVINFILCGRDYLVLTF